MIVADLKDGARMFHSLCRFDRHVFSFVYQNVRRNNDMEGNREIGVVIDGRIPMGSLCFNYTPVPTIYFCFSLVERQSEFQRVSKVSKFRVNHLSTIYHCAIHNLSTLSIYLSPHACLHSLGTSPVSRGGGSVVSRGLLRE